ncbi:acyltransferase family protein [Pseudochrobactrum kiredjianiae]|uniref:Acyltransferase family protein n=1 Tax=Pseudochrobactrum kiredjianiae TaxID=386305 RepID=A0ABW3V0B5_9HYPH|nr:acyltransferase [Pseudochrobactrum kiredjianiae]MDM7852320.1 acyltransferase [Pseudochrobactrum kiredjianiae]
MTYRDDIDGLRAIAVIAVIFSHIHLMPGGYIGVDVFFVISGFLIAPRILEKIKSNEFSIFDFYTRRAKRLLPQVYAVIFANFVAAYLLFAPSDIIAFGKSAIATVLYGSNFYFLAQTGYFAPDAITQPLLHTWSLAVEEQFYFVAPLIIYGLVKLQRPLLFGALIGLASLLACLLTTQLWTSANFFLLPFRAWEFIIGAAIAYVPLPPRNFRNVSAFSGLALIALSALTLKETSLFPGVNAVPVVAGTALIIWSGSATTLAKVLATLPLRLTGRASYSLYIWHWPIIVFYSYYSYNDFSFNAQLQMLVATFIAGFLFWYVFEEPIRKSKITFRFAVVATVSASLSVVAVSLFIKHEKGIPQ